MVKLQPRSGAEVVSVAANENHKPKDNTGEIQARSIFATWKATRNKDAGLNNASYQLGQLAGAGLLKYSRAVHLLREQMKLLAYPDHEYAGARESLELGRSKGIAVEDIPDGTCSKIDKPNLTDDTVDAETLLGMDFPPLNYIIPGYVVEGLTVLGGKPKLGKSWWAYDAGIAVATGGRAMGNVECEQGDVLYLALEDNHRRVQDRLKILCPLRKQLGITLTRLSIRTIAPRIDNGLFEELDKWRLASANPRLIIIDVYMKVRPPRKRGEDVYAADYAAVVPLQQYASSNRIAVVLVTHTRKMEAEDPLESISGTNGVTGAADAVLVLSRDSKGTVLYGRGRDIEEIETAMRFDGGRWTILGDADEVRISTERRKILAALRESWAPLAPKAIAEATGLKAVNVRNLLPKMRKAGEVVQPEAGIYALPTPITVVTPVTP